MKKTGPKRRTLKLRFDGHASLPRAPRPIDLGNETMARLVKVQDIGECASPLTLQQGDVILFHAVGGRVRSGRAVVEFLGAYVPGILADNGSIVSPLGAPNTVLFRTRQPGRASVEIISGDPFHRTESTAVEINVEE